VIEMISVEAALQQVLEAASPLGHETVDLREAAGRVLAQTLLAPHDLPPFDNSAMDGFALRAEDTRSATASTPVRLRVVGESAAGRGYGADLHRGEAIAISTGAPVPRGADAVVPVEQVTVQEGWIALSEPVRSGRHVRSRGEDIATGTEVLRAGERVRLSHVALLAALGLTPLSVYRRPQVSVLVTGNELLPYDAPLRADSIRDSNSVMLATWLAARGYRCWFAGTAPDSLPALVQALEDALHDAEVLILTGGVSVGEHDLVKPALPQIGAEVVFWRVNMKPGKPIVFAKRVAQGGSPQAIFGLPGNPLSALVGLFVFVLPYLAAVEGEANPSSRYVTARLGTDVHKKESRAEFQTARLCGTAGATLRVVPTPTQGSSLLGSLAQANAFLYLPAGEGVYTEGTLVKVLPVAPLEECG